MQIQVFSRFVGYRSGSFFNATKSQSITAAASKVITLLIVVFLFADSAQAQPVKDQASIVQLKRQLAQLQSQMASIQQEKNDPFKDNSRVKSVGSQRIKRAPETVQTLSLHIRLYDLSDLFAASPSYPAVMPNDLSMSSAMFAGQRGQMLGGYGQGGGGQGGSMGGGGGGGVFSVPPTTPTARTYSPVTAPKKQEAASLNLRSAQVSMDQLVNTIKETVEPDTWGSSRDSAKVQFLGNTLLITATEDMHTQITNLLNLFRQHWGKRRTVSIQTYLVRASASETTNLLDRKTNDEIGAGVVEKEKWKTFMESAKTEKRIAYSATLTGHNNQTLHALSGRQRQLTVDAIPFETTEATMWFENIEDVDPFGDDSDHDEDMDYFNRTRKVVGFKPVRQSFHHGTAIQVTPLATRGGNFVILDLHAKVNELVEPDAESKKPSIFVNLEKEGKAEIELDHANFVTYRLNTTLRCPKDQVVLAGSMTYDPNSDSDRPNLYLFVKTSVHTITEDESDWTMKKIEKK